jgi:hypothetical protein
VKGEALKQAQRIRDELRQIGIMVSHVQRDWSEFVRTGHDAYLKAVAYDLHGFYTGLERIFETVFVPLYSPVTPGNSSMNSCVSGIEYETYIPLT